MADLQETSVIADVCDGNYENYRFLVERYHRGLIQHLYNMTHDMATAEDVAQEAFVRAYDKLAQYNPAYSFSTWLYKIADNIAYGQLRKQRPTEDLDAYQEHVADGSPSLGELTDQQLTKETVRAAVAALPLAYQRVIALYYWDGCSYEEIAVIMDRPIGTVRTWLHRAKEQLRKELYGQV